MTAARAAILELWLLAQWVLWRYEPRESDGKPTKVLYNARTRKRASSTDPRTWASYQEAEAAHASDPEHWQGVGFVVSSGDPYCGIDLDHCISADGVIAEWALAIVRRLNSYTEVTPSGRGLRVWVRGTLPPFGRKKTWTAGGRQCAIELYDEGRYFTVTGRHWEGTPETIEERQAELEALHAEVFPVKPKAATVYQPREPLTVSDEELLDRAMRSKRGEKFRRLWDGDLTDYADDRSRADLALCSLLRFWTQADTGRIDRLFRRSGLMREKWDRRLGGGTYGSVTIQKALPGDVYDPQRGSRVPDEGVFEDFEDISGEKSAGEWSPPIPFRDLKLPPFPLDALPKTLRDYVEAKAEELQVPAELVVTYALSCVALAMSKKVEVRPKPGWWEPVNLWLLCVTKPGSRSSEVRRAVTAPVEEFERSLRKAKAPEIARQAASYEVKKKRLARLLDQAAKTDNDDERQDPEGQAKDLAAELETTRVPVPPRLLADDVTPEKLASMMADQGGRMAILSPEGGVFGMMAGRYSKDGEPNLEIYLKGHAGDDHKVDRGGREEEIPKCALTLGLRVQPCVIREIARKAGFRGKGLLGRFGYLLPRETLGERNVNSLPAPPAAVKAFEETVQRLLAIPDALGESGAPLPREMAFSRGARTVFLEFCALLEPRLGEWGDLGAMTDWAGKLAGLVARIAGLIHAWVYAEDHPDVPGQPFEPWRSEITAETVKDAIRIGEYLIPHAREAFAQMAADPNVENARHILGWVLRQEGDEFTKRDLWQAMRRCTDRFQSVDDQEPALSLLMDHGYIRVKPENDGRGRGRPSVIFQVNPLAKCPQNPQKSGAQARGFECGSERDCNQEPEEIDE